MSDSDSSYIERMLEQAAKGDKKAVAVLQDLYDTTPHGPACARRLLDSAECDCIKDRMAEFVK